jgi:hypothetical protein
MISRWRRSTGNHAVSILLHKNLIRGGLCPWLPPLKNERNPVRSPLLSSHTNEKGFHRNEKKKKGKKKEKKRKRKKITVIDDQ